MSLEVCIPAACTHFLVDLIERDVAQRVFQRAPQGRGARRYNCSARSSARRTRNDRHANAVSGPRTGSANPQSCTANSRQRPVVAETKAHRRSLRSAARFRCVTGFLFCFLPPILTEFVLINIGASRHSRSREQREHEFSSFRRTFLQFGIVFCFVRSEDKSLAPEGRQTDPHQLMNSDFYPGVSAQPQQRYRDRYPCVRSAIDWHSLSTEELYVSNSKN